VNDTGIKIGVGMVDMKTKNAKNLTL